jgi:hypothetical protein
MEVSGQQFNKGMQPHTLLVESPLTKIEHNQEERYGPQ